MFTWRCFATDSRKHGKHLRQLHEKVIIANKSWKNVFFHLPSRRLPPSIFLLFRGKQKINETQEKESFTEEKSRIRLHPWEIIFQLAINKDQGLISTPITVHFIEDATETSLFVTEGESLLHCMLFVGTFRVPSEAVQIGYKTNNSNFFLFEARSYRGSV